MNCKIINEIPFGARTITPKKFAGTAKTVPMEFSRETLLGVDNRVVVRFKQGLNEVPVGPATTVLVAAGVEVFGYPSAPPVKVIMKTPTQSRKVGY